MATYTDNYQLTKPTYAEQADIGVINSNMNIIDDIMHSSQVSLAPAYDSTQTYAEGDVVMYELLMYKCISPTTGVWDASKWERTTASESGGGGSAELDILGEGNGAVVSFSDGASAGLAKCIADITPVQDLHGYDKPWAGGAGKNILENTLVSGSTTGVTYTVNDDGTVSLSGTASTDVDIIIPINLASGDYYFSGCEDGGGNSTYDVYAYDITSRARLRKWDGTTTSLSCFDSDDYEQIKVDDTHTNQLRIRVRNGCNVTGKVFKPMICASTTIEPADFEPYSNICPISGSTSVTVTVSDGETSTTKTTPLGQTVYGGQLNVLTGELTIDKAFLQIDGDSTIAWATQSSWTAGCWYNGTIMAGAKNISGYGTKANIISNMGEAQTPSDLTNNTALGVAHGNGTTLYVRVDNTLDTVEKFRTFLNNSPLQIVYELATPQTVQLTPQEVNSLLGQNNISADTGDVDIVYVKASAPIQPNPTGTPTATLKKLGIEGTVFELEGGGGGSSSGINYSTTEKVVGTAEDENGIIKPLYEKMIYIPSLPNTTEAEYSLGVINIRNIYYIKCIAETSTIALPLFYNAGNDNNSKIQMYVSDKLSGKIKINTFNDNRSSMSGTVIIRYTKTTD